MKSMESNGYAAALVRAKPRRKLSCEGPSEGFDSETVPSSIIFGVSDRLLAVTTAGSAEEDSTPALATDPAAPVAAALTSAEWPKNCRLLTRRHMAADFDLKKDLSKITRLKKTFLPN